MNKNNYNLKTEQIDFFSEYRNTGLIIFLPFISLFIITIVVVIMLYIFNNN